MKTLALFLVVAVLAAGCLQEKVEPAPAFTLVDTEGQVHNLTTAEGKVLVIDLMATWCVPCIAQMEHLNALRDAYPEDQVQILSVGTDAGESEDQLLRFKEQYDGRWPFARDTDQVARKLGLRILPKLVIISPTSEIVFEAQGEVYPAAMARVINRYVEASA